VAAGNPKAILIFTAFFPQFVDRTHYALSFAVLGATFLVLELVAIAIYALIGARLRFITGNPKGFIWLNRVSGSLMVGFGTLLAMLRRPA
jgi:threonine/homoserine/homoserine lactone efflux protein